jgi:hypothetical protein
MGHGARDDGDILKDAGFYRLDDLAELAWRLESPVDYQRYGDAVLYDDFSSGLAKCGVQAVAPDGYARISSTLSKSRGCSLKMCSGTGLNPYVTVIHGVPFPMLVSCGYKVSFYFPDIFTELYFYLVMEDGTQAVEFIVLLSWALAEFRIQTTGGAWVTVKDDVYPVSYYPSFHSLKVVGDFSTHNYVRLYYDDLELDLSKYPGVVTPIITPPRVYGMTYFTGDTINLQYVYLDNIVLSNNDRVAVQ